MELCPAQMRWCLKDATTGGQEISEMGTGKGFYCRVSGFFLASDWCDMR
jgi:hypothetical protein